MAKKKYFETPEELEKQINKYFADCDKKEKPYTVSGLALSLNISPETLRIYQEYEDYKDIVNLAKVRIMNCVEENALTGKYNSSFSQFSLKYNFKWTDTTQVINTNVNSNTDISVEDMDKRIKELLDK